ncbi:hypothetical protein NQ314_019525 [Rhamnusium bicolor]|uniref:ATP synthase F0 subunit 8 n=1 Tax=Rhamnusium bicolor TaxID=1586634 RepID=A0AAV8WNZ7_9CUCU|nr:hypothetical protein NQ314_019525 [Rhamnusium bicolor]
MDYLVKMHSKFLQDVMASSQLDSNPYTTVPTIIFLVCAFVLLYLQFHRYTFPTTRWKTRLYKDVIFHWVYFYIARIWFLFLKFGRYIISTLDSYIEMTCRKDEIFVNQTINHALVFMLALTLSMVPLLILSVQQIYRRNMPNFFIWVAEDPWLRSEIGTSGHYLERPARFASSYKTRNSAYRSRRSTSADTDIFEDKKSLTFRPCKSLTTINAKSFNDLAE